MQGGLRAQLPACLPENKQAREYDMKVNLKCFPGDVSGFSPSEADHITVSNRLRYRLQEAGTPRNRHLSLRALPVSGIVVAVLLSQQFGLGEKFL